MLLLKSPCIILLHICEVSGAGCQLRAPLCKQRYVVHNASVFFLLTLWAMEHSEQLVFLEEILKTIAVLLSE